LHLLIELNATLNAQRSTLNAQRSTSNDTVLGPREIFAGKQEMRGYQ
jgi:hypothetical protein